MIGTGFTNVVKSAVSDVLQLNVQPVLLTQAGALEARLQVAANWQVSDSVINIVCWSAGFLRV